MKQSITLIIIIFVVCTSYSQILIDTSYCSFDSVNNFYKVNKFVKMSEIISDNSSALKTSNNNVISENWNYKDISGITHHNFTQKINGIPVEYSQIYFREKNDTVISATGLLNVNCPPANINISSSNAINIVLNKLNCYKYKWQDSTYEADIKIEKKDEIASYYPKPQLVITKIDKYNYNNSMNYIYAYPIKISAIYSEIDSIYTDSVYYVNAVDGTIFKKHTSKASCFNNSTPQNPTSTSACSQDCMSTGVTLHYYGGQTIYTEKFLHSLLNCTHRLKDNCTGTYLYVKYNNSSANEKDFRSNNNLWNSGGNPSDRAGSTALWCLEKTHEFYRNVFGRNSFDNNFSQMKIVIATNVSTKTGWDMINNYMDVGIANGTSSYEESLDIIGHEISHGVTDQICYMTQDVSISSNDEEGALSEGYSDIFGQAVEHYVHNNYSTNGAIDDYFQGSNIPGGITYQKQRYLYNPNINGHPDTYLGTNYQVTNPGGSNWHRNSTIMSHWFYLLAEGGANTNDLGNNYCVRGIGQAKATQIAYNSLFYLGGTAKQFINARSATIQAAIQLYGLVSPEVQEVIAAWYAVGVGSSPASSALGYIQLGSKTETGSNNYHYNNALRLDLYTVQPSVGVNVSSNTEIVISSTHLNPPIYPPTFGDTKIKQGSEFHAYIAPACAGGARMGNTNYDGEKSTSNEVINSNERKSEIAQAFHDIDVFPNPSNGNFTVSLNDNAELPKSIIVRDVLGKEIINIHNPKEYIQNIDLKPFNNGIYIIVIYYSNDIITKRIMKI